MEAVRTRSLVAPSFSVASAGCLADPKYTFEPDKHWIRTEDKITIEERASVGQPLTTCWKSQRASFPPLCGPPNFAALRCDWHHRAVLSLITPHLFPGNSLQSGDGDRQANGTRAYQEQADRTAEPQRCLHSPSLVQIDPPARLALQQANIQVGYQGDWLEVSPAMLRLWTAASFEPYAGQKPVQYFVLCPEECVQQAKAFLKDLDANYELSKLGTHHSILQTSWLYTFSTDCSPGCGVEQPISLAQQAWQQLSLEQRYLQALRSAAEQLQHVLLSTPLQLLQSDQTLEVQFGSTPVIYIICPFEITSTCLISALLEVAQCLAPCTPLGATCRTSCLSEQHHDAADSLADMQDTSVVQTSKFNGSQALQTSEPGGNLWVDCKSSEAMQPAAAQLGLQQAGSKLHDRLHGAVHGLFNHANGRILGQQSPAPLHERAQPDLDLTLQIINSHCLADISGQMAKSMAFEVYTKIQRPLENTPEIRRVSALGETDLSVSLRSEPPFILSPAFPQPGVVEEAVQGAASQEQPAIKLSRAPHKQDNACTTMYQHRFPRNLHCCYALPQSFVHGIPCNRAPDRHVELLNNCTAQEMRQKKKHPALLFPATWTDSCGELMHSEVLHVPLPNNSVDVWDLESPDSNGSSQTTSLCGQICDKILQRSLDVFKYLQCASQPRQLLQNIVISRLGKLSRLECNNWSQILANRQQLLPGERLEKHLTVLSLTSEPTSREVTSPIYSQEIPLCLYKVGKTFLEASMENLSYEDPGMLQPSDMQSGANTLSMQVLLFGAPSLEYTLSVVADVCRLYMLNVAYLCLLDNHGSLSDYQAACIPGRRPLSRAASPLPFHAHLARNLLFLLYYTCSE